MCRYHLWDFRRRRNRKCRHNIRINLTDCIGHRLISGHTFHDKMTEGLMVFNGATSKLFMTGEWRTNTPVFYEDKCKQCLDTASFPDIRSFIAIIHFPPSSQSHQKGRHLHKYRTPYSGPYQMPDVSNGEMDTEFIPVESEHSSMSAAIGAEAAGARSLTATSSAGLALMWEEFSRAIS